MKKCIAPALIFLLFSCKKEEKPVQTEVAAEEAKPITAVYHWQDDLCDYVGEYDPRKYTVKQLDDTQFLANCAGRLDLDADTHISSLKDFDTFDKEALADELDSQYSEWKRKYKNLDIIPLPFWQNLRKQLLEALDQRYELKKIMLESYDDPQVLLNNRFADNCREYGEALASRDTAVIIAAWRDFYEKKVSSGKMHPDALTYLEEKYNSADRMRYAIADLSTYAWYNCANQQIKDADTDISYLGEFSKLFANIESVCDEP